jgi:hypothetical protein
VDRFVPEDGEPDFFCPPRADLGRPVAAYTSLARHEQPKPLAARLLPPLLISAGIIAALVIGTVVLQLVATNPLPPVALALGLPFLIGVALYLVFSIAFERSAFDHQCGYVGTQGCAFYSCKGSRDQLEPEQGFLYAQAAYLRVLTTHVFFEESYSYTNYVYIWTDRNNAALMEIRGMHGAHHHMPSLSSSYHLARVAEQVWSEYVLKVVLAKLAGGEAVDFPLSGDDCIRLRQGALQLHLQGKTQDFTPGDLAEMSIKEGHVALKEPGAQAGWFTESGFHRFEFADIANAQVFLLLMNQLFGIPIT